MKKLLALITIISALAFYANAQNSNPWPASGNVGIGTLSPPEALSINGGANNGKIYSAVGSADAIMKMYRWTGVSTSYYPWYLATGRGSGGASFSIMYGTSGNVGSETMTDALSISNSGNVGIGTSTPDEKLVVYGSVKSVLDGNYQAKNVARIMPLGVSGASGARNWTIRGVYQYWNGVNNNADGGDLDLIKSLDGNTILATKSDGTSLGNVGIGTTSPGSTLNVASNSINGQLRLSDATSAYHYDLGRISSTGGFEINGTQSASVSYAFKAGGTSRMYIATNGNISIGTNDAQGYKLAVNGTAIATEMTVKLYGNWPDYVFKPTYKLPALSEVKTFIEANQHLPDMPSEAEVTEKGIKLGEINTLLLKKVEELTLYLIEQNKKLENQENEIKQYKQQQQSIQQQEIRIKNLEQLIGKRKTL